MDPKQRFPVILKYFAVKRLIIFFGALIRMLCPKRRRIADRNRTLHNLCLFDRLFLLLASILFRAVALVFRLFHDLLDHRILFSHFLTRDRLIFGLRIFICQENLYRHE